MKGKKIYFLTVFEDENGGFWGKFPDFFSCTDQGETLEEVVDNATQTLEELIATMVEHGEKLPEPSDAKSIKRQADSEDGEIAFVVPITVYPPTKTERFNLTTTGDKLERINDYAKRHHISRSELMVNATLEMISHNP